MLERVYINEQIAQLTRDLLNERAQVEHLQATIADLQGQVEKWQEIASLRFAGDHKFVKEMELLKVENSALQQRVAQLEAMLAEEHPGLDEACDKLAILQADHARVLGLVQAAVVRIEQVEGDLHAALNGTRHDPSWIRPIQLSRNERQELYLGCESQLKAIRQSLPAQPAQGGA